MSEPRVGPDDFDTTERIRELEAKLIKAERRASEFETRYKNLMVEQFGMDWEKSTVYGIPAAHYGGLLSALSNVSEEDVANILAERHSLRQDLVYERAARQSETNRASELFRALAAMTVERNAYKKAKQENDERFMIERDEARREADMLRVELDQLRRRDGIIYVAPQGEATMSRECFGCGSKLNPPRNH